MLPYIIITLVTVALAVRVRKTEYAGDGSTINDLGLRRASGKQDEGLPENGLFFDRGIARWKVLDFVLLMSIFVLLFGLSALRYKVGNDYTRYEEFFHLIPLKQVVPTEVGFNISVLVLQWIFGKEAALPIFTVYAFVTVMFMVLAVYEQSRDFLFSFFLFMTLSFYFQSLNTVRYYLAWAVAVYSMKYVLRREYLKFILTVLITATIHKSILLVIPIYLLSSVRLKKWHYGLITLLALSGPVLKDYYLRLIIRFYPSYEGTSYLSGGTSVINIIRIAAVFVMSIICYRQSIKGDRAQEFYMRLNYFALLLYTCGSFIPEISRVGYYLSAGHIFLIPGMVNGIEDVRVRKAVRAVTAMGAVVYFGAFLYLAREPLVRIVPYHSWVTYLD